MSVSIEALNLIPGKRLESSYSKFLKLRKDFLDHLQEINLEDYRIKPLLLSQQKQNKFQARVTRIMQSKNCFLFFNTIASGLINCVKATGMLSTNLVQRHRYFKVTGELDKEQVVWTAFLAVLMAGFYCKEPATALIAVPIYFSSYATVLPLAKTKLEEKTIFFNINRNLFFNLENRSNKIALSLTEHYQNILEAADEESIKEIIMSVSILLINNLAAKDYSKHLKVLDPEKVYKSIDDMIDQVLINSVLKSNIFREYQQKNEKQSSISSEFTEHKSFCSAKPTQGPVITR